MAIHFNHTILSAHGSKASAIFLAEMLNLPAPRRWGPFQMVVTENGANLDYMDTDDEITPQHYAFLTSEAEFDEIFGRILDRKLSYWADPGEGSQVRSITTTADAVSTSKTRTATCLKSSPARTAAADGIHETWQAAGFTPSATASGLFVEILVAAPLPQERGLWAISRASRIWVGAQSKRVAQPNT